MVALARDPADVSPIAGRVWQLMQERKVSAKVLALRSGLGQDAVKNILRGRSLAPRLNTLEAVARGLGVEVGVLVGEAPPPPPPDPMLYALETRRLRRARRGLDDGIADTAEMPSLTENQRQQQMQRALPRESTIAQGFLELPVVSLRPGPESLLMDPARQTGAKVVLPASLAGDAASQAVVARSPDQFPPEIPPAAWLVIDPAARGLGRGIFLLHDGFEHVLVRGIGAGRSSLADEERDAKWVVTGRVVGKLTLG